MSFITIVIPAYNCENTIGRLLNSIAGQNMKDLHIIVCDDSDSEHDQLYAYIQPYEKLLSIEYYKRENEPYKIHCPGNTRHSGLRRALEQDTTYIMFADCDDDFYGDVLPKLKQTLTEAKGGMPDVVCTKFHVFSPRGDLVRTETFSLGWLHGKLWRKDFLLRHGIQFKVDMATHEDLYFNSLVNYHQIVDGTVPANASDDLIYYRWHQRVDSTTHKDYDGTDEIYIQKHFNEYVYADVEVYMEMALKENISDPEVGGHLAIRCAFSIFSAYCYIQSFLTRGKLYRLQNAYRALKRAIWQYYQTFGMSDEDLVKIVYADPMAALNHRKQSYIPFGYYLEQESFRDFIRRMRFYE